MFLLFWDNSSRARESETEVPAGHGGGSPWKPIVALHASDDDWRCECWRGHHGLQFPSTRRRRRHRQLVICWKTSDAFVTNTQQTFSRVSSVIIFYCYGSIYFIDMFHDNSISIKIYSLHRACITKGSSLFSHEPRHQNVSWFNHMAFSSQWLELTVVDLHKSSCLSVKSVIHR